MTTNNTFRIDTEILISMIELKPCIWDTSDDNYKNREVKQQAFEEVAAVVVSNYNTFDEAKKQEAVKFVQQRWKSARDAYRRDQTKIRNTKSVQALKQFKKYVFFDNLKFLDGVLHINGTEANADFKEEFTLKFEEELSDISELEEQHAFENNEAISPLPTNTHQRKRRKKYEDAESVSYYLPPSLKGDDDFGDRAFMESILPTLKTFDEGKRLQFRAEVLRVMMELKNIPTVLQARMSQTENLFAPTYLYTAQLVNKNMSPSTTIIQQPDTMTEEDFREEK